jgi:hypothetical protein
MWGAMEASRVSQRNRSFPTATGPSRVHHRDLEAGGASWSSRSPLQVPSWPSPQLPTPLSGRQPWPAILPPPRLRHPHPRRRRPSAPPLPPFPRQNRWYRPGIMPKLLILEPKLGPPGLPQIRPAAVPLVPPPVRISKAEPSRSLARFRAASRLPCRPSRRWPTPDPTRSVRRQPCEPLRRTRGGRGIRPNIRGINCGR